MAIQAGNLAPSAFVVAVAGYLCWSYWDDAPAGPPADSKLPAIAAGLLNPDLGAAAGRDPFGTTVAFQLDDDAANDSTPGKGKLQGGKAGQTGGAASNKPNPPPVQKLTGKEATNILAGYVLHATYIQANHRVALINGRTYSRGESIDSTDPKAAPLLLSEIHQHKVVLDYQGKQVDLGYANTSHTQNKARPQAGGQRPPAKPQRSASNDPASPKARSRGNRTGQGGTP